MPLYTLPITDTLLTDAHLRLFRHFACMVEDIKANWQRVTDQEDCQSFATKKFLQECDIDKEHWKITVTQRSNRAKLYAMEQKPAKLGD